MKCAYNIEWLSNLELVKEAKSWQKQGWLTKVQFDNIAAVFPSFFYHPNLFIRILLFIATLIALSGVSGILGLMFASTGESVLSILCIIYGIVSLIFLENVFLKKNHHYKSGVSEALLYHSLGFFIGGVAVATDGNVYVILFCCIAAFGFAAIRYIDLISTLLGWGSLAFLLFYSLDQAGGIFQQLIPIIIIVSFLLFYFLVIRFKKKKENEVWENCFLLSEAFCHLLVYAAGNYLVVRELSISMMNMQLEEGQDIPLAWLFYALTAIVPVAFLYFGITKKNIVLIRVSLVVIAFAVFTFKYYFSLGHHEISLTLGGAILIGIAVWLFQFLKTPRNGFTAENVLTERWGSANLSAFIISQSMGGNKVQENGDVPGGGSFGGGGSTESF